MSCRIEDISCLALENVDYEQVNVFSKITNYNNFSCCGGVFAKTKWHTENKTRIVCRQIKMIIIIKRISKEIVFAFFGVNMYIILMMIMMIKAAAVLYNGYSGSVWHDNNNAIL